MVSTAIVASCAIDGLYMASDEPAKPGRYFYHKSKTRNSGDLSIPADGHKWGKPSKACAALLSPTLRASLEMFMFLASTQGSDGDERKAKCQLCVVFSTTAEWCAELESLLLHL